MGKKKSKALVTKNKDGLLPWQERIAWELIDGKGVGAIARAMAPNDKVRQKSLREKIRRLGRQEDFQNFIGEMSKVGTIMAVPSTVEAVARKARAGRVDAAKLIFEASGFHNPRIQHDHGGEVVISIRNAPRPERVKEEYLGDRQLNKVIDIPEAEVVDD